MSKKTDSSSAPSAPSASPKLSLRREQLQHLTVRAGVKTGAACGPRSGGGGCEPSINWGPTYTCINC